MANFTDILRIYNGMHWPLVNVFVSHLLALRTGASIPIPSGRSLPQ